MNSEEDYRTDSNSSKSKIILGHVPESCDDLNERSSLEDEAEDYH